MTEDEGLIKNRTEAILRELQTVISVFYILMVGIGMVFEYQKYAQFGINIFDYANVFDFLIAPFKSPVIFIFILASLLISYIAFKFDLFMKRKWPRFYQISSFGMAKKEWYAIFRLISVIIVFITYIFVSSQIFAKDFKDGFFEDSRKIRVTYTDNKQIEGHSIGGTNEVLFLLVDDAVKIVPTASLVKEIDLNFEPYPKKSN